MACMASRIPYGSVVTKEKLKQVEAMEDFPRRKGVCGIPWRRITEVSLRIELGEDEMAMLQKGTLTSELVDFAKRMGFVCVHAGSPGVPFRKHERGAPA
ncbi:MAG: hypothetical protein MZU91_01645 [Desulfosudis oleivorans]|nr:hypothetical protein [Desulfosudis oleivorans]